MERRDLLQYQIEQIGKILGQILHDLVVFTGQGGMVEAVESAEAQLQGLLELECSSLLELDDEALREEMAARQFTPAHLEMLSDILREFGSARRIPNPAGARLYYEKALVLLDIADESSKTYSTPRQHRKEELRDLLAQF